MDLSCSVYVCTVIYLPGKDGRLSWPSAVSVYVCQNECTSGAVSSGRIFKGDGDLQEGSAESQTVHIIRWRGGVRD